MHIKNGFSLTLRFFTLITKTSQIKYICPVVTVAVGYRVFHVFSYVDNQLIVWNILFQITINRFCEFICLHSHINIKNMLGVIDITNMIPCRTSSSDENEIMTFGKILLVFCHYQELQFVLWYTILVGILVHDMPSIISI